MAVACKNKQEEPFVSGNKSIVPDNSTEQEVVHIGFGFSGDFNLTTSVTVDFVVPGRGGLTDPPRLTELPSNQAYSIPFPLYHIRFGGGAK